MRFDSDNPIEENLPLASQKNYQIISSLLSTQQGKTALTKELNKIEAKIENMILINTGTNDDIKQTQGNKFVDYFITVLNRKNIESNLETFLCLWFIQLGVYWYSYNQTENLLFDDNDAIFLTKCSNLNIIDIRMIDDSSNNDSFYHVCAMYGNVQLLEILLTLDNNVMKYKNNYNKVSKIDHESLQYVSVWLILLSYIVQSFVLSLP